MYVYRNRNTGHVVEYDRPSARLEHLGNWERMSVAPQVPTDGDGATGAASRGAGRPARSASKTAWRAWARRQADGTVEAIGVDRLTKEELIRRYGSDG